MRITKRQLKRIIREEYRKITRGRQLNEMEMYDMDYAGRRMDKQVVEYEPDSFVDGMSLELGFLSINNGMDEARITVAPSFKEPANVSDAVMNALADIGVSPSGVMIKYVMGGQTVPLNKFINDMTREAATYDDY